MRDQMPKVTEFVDACREVFGANVVNSSIRDGMAGLPSFFAEEGGFSIGTKDRDPAFSVTGNQLVSSLKTSSREKKP